MYISAAGFSIGFSAYTNRVTSLVKANIEFFPDEDGAMSFDEFRQVYLDAGYDILDQHSNSFLHAALFLFGWCVVLIHRTCSVYAPKKCEELRSFIL